MKVIGKIKALLGLDKKGFDKGLDKASKKTSKLSATFKRLGGVIAGAFAVSKITGMIKQTINLSDELGKLSKQTGISTENLQKYQYAGERAGISTAKTSQSLQVFQKRLGELQTGSGSLYSQLNKMDSAFVKQLQSTSNIDEAFALYADKIKNAKNETEQATLAQAAFSRSGLDMTRLLREGSAGLQQYGDALERSGGILSKDLIDAAEAYKDQQLDMNMAFRGMKGLLLTAIMPALSNLTQSLTKVASWINDNRAALSKWLTIIGKTVGVFAAAKAAIWTYQKAALAASLATKGLKTGFKGLNRAMKANIFIAVASAVAGLVFWFIETYKESAKFRAQIKYVAQSIAASMNKAFIQIKMQAEMLWLDIKSSFKGIATLGKAAWEAIKAGFKGKNPVDVFNAELKKGADNTKQQAADIRKKYEAEFAKIESPNYQEILNKELAAQKGKEAGQAAAKGIQQALSEGAIPALQGKGADQISTGGGPEAIKSGFDFADTGLIDEMNNKMFMLQQRYRAFGNEVNIVGEKQRLLKETINGLLTQGFDVMNPKVQGLIEQLRLLKEEEEKVAKATNSIGQEMKQSAEQMGASFATALANGKASTKELVKQAKSTAIAQLIKWIMTSVPFPANIAVASGAGLTVGKLFNAVGMKEGGVVPPGYPNDTYPAMLSSGETVTPPKKLPQGRGMGGELVARVSGRDLEFVLKQHGKNINRVT